MIGNDYSVKQKIRYLVEGGDGNESIVMGNSGLNDMRDRLIRGTQRKITEAGGVSDLYQLKDWMEDISRELYDRYRVPTTPFTIARVPNDALFDAIVGGRMLEGTEYVPHLFVVFEDGTSDEIDDYRAVGDGERHANNIVKSLYDPNMTKERALQVAIHAIIQTARIDSAVDAIPQVALIDNDGSRILNVDAHGWHETIPQIEDLKKQVNGVATKQAELFDLWLNGPDELRRKLSDVFDEWKGRKKELV